MKLPHISSIESYRVAMSGLLGVFLVRILIELAPTVYMGIAIAMIALGIILARLTAKHFDHHHHHTGDSAVDAIPVAMLLFANIAHPAIDGFTVVETFRLGGAIAGALYAGSVAFHEILRQSAFVTAFSVWKINWKYVVGTALIGMSIGVGTSIAGADLLGRYEYVADLATLFSYSFVIAEFRLIKGHEKIKYSKALFVMGILVGIAIIVLTNAH